MYGKEIGDSKINPQIKNIKDLDLQALEKPKTLIILHYKGKRMSVPLFQETFNLSSLLNHHIIKLEQTILSKGVSEVSQQLNNEIVCFQIKKDANQQLKYQNISDGDLRSDILLSLLRVEQNQAPELLEELKVKIDVTKIYKYLEIQSYYRYQENQISQIYHHEKHTLKNKSPYFHFYRSLGETTLSSTFLARKISNGYFYSVKVYSEGARCGQQDLHNIEMIEKIDQMRKDELNIKCSLLVRSHKIVLIPHPEVEESQESEDESSCKYISIVYPYFVRGTLEDLLKDARFNRTRRIAEMDCLNYLKELMWGAYLLHEKYNLVHRAIVPANLHIDQNGQLRLTNYSSCLQCYDSSGNHANYTYKGQRISATKRSYSNLEELFQNGEYDVGQYTPPEVIKGHPYNYLVDFYSIGVIIRKLYELSQTYERVPISQNNQNLMMTMINKLTSPNLTERANVVNEIIQDIERQSLQNLQSARQLSNLVLQDIKVGRQIQNNESKKFIENEQVNNGIDMKVLVNYFHQPKLKVNNTINRSSKKEKKLSKEKISIKNSRQKSEKCLSKGSVKSSSKDLTITKIKNSSFQKQTHGSHFKDTKQSREISSKNMIQSPVSHKKSKSKSQEKKRKSQTSKQKEAQRLWAQFEQKNKSKKLIQSIPTLPKSPKVNTTLTRNKSPGQRDK